MPAKTDKQKHTEATAWARGEGHGNNNNNFSGVHGGGGALGSQRPLQCSAGRLLGRCAPPHWSTINYSGALAASAPGSRPESAQVASSWGLAASQASAATARQLQLQVRCQGPAKQGRGILYVYVCSATEKADAMWVQRRAEFCGGMRRAVGSIAGVWELCSGEEGAS